MERRHLVRPYQVAVIGSATVLIAWSGSRLRFAELGWQFLVLALATLALGSRITIRLPGLKSEFSFSDFFIFVAILQFPGEAAVLLAATEAYLSSFRVTRKSVTRIFNGAALACSTSITVLSLTLFFGPPDQLAQSGFSLKTVIATFALGLLQYVANSCLVGFGVSLQADEAFWQLWKRFYLWATIPYLASACSAVLTVRLVQTVGLYALVISGPIIVMVYLAFKTNIRYIESVAAQAEQARQHLAELRESEERFRSAFDNAAIGMALVSTEGRWTKVNDALCRMLGVGEADLLGAEAKAVVHPDDFARALSPLERLGRGEAETHEAETRLLRRNGEALWALISIARIHEPQTGAIQLNFQIQDITDRKRAEEQLVHDAFHDALTGLPNRALFMDRLKLALDHVRRNRRRQFAVLLLDLDRFKIVNDSLGHTAGDQLLVVIAQRLQACMRPGDSLAHLGGDEFSILLDDIDDVREAIHVADRIAEALSHPFVVGGREVFATASIGIAPGGATYERPDEVLRDADTAMHRAKSLGKARHEVFDRAMHERAMFLLQLETDLRRAVEREEFLLHYQPIVSLQSGAVEGFEALVRWRHPRQGFVSPGEFIPVAEESGLIAPIGGWVLREACRQARAWRLDFAERPRLTVAVNLSRKQFAQGDLFEEVTMALADAGCDPRALKLEITESTVMENVETAIATITRLRELGVESSIDDFGTGYSSLSQLHCFPAATLKIDRAFVAGLGQKAENTEIVRTVVLLARALRMNVVAEGIETEAQLAQLRELGCEYGQGFLFSKPLPADAATTLLASSRTFPVVPSQELFFAGV